MRKEREWLKTLITILLLLAMIPLFLPGLFSSERLVYQGDKTSSDITEANFPRRDLLGRGLKAGRIPLWTSLIGCGFPLLGEGQTGVLYPLNLLFFRLFDPIPAYNFSVILSFIISLIFCYLLARDLGLSRFASAFSSISFTFSAFMVARIKFMNMINALAWLPACTWSMRRLADGLQLKYLIWTGIFFSLQILAGNPQIFYITLIFSIAIFLYQVLPEWRKRWQENQKAGLVLVGKTFSYLIILLVLILVLSSPQFLAQWEGRGISTRPGGVTQEDANIYPYNPISLILFFNPFQLGNPAQHTYTDQRTIFWENVSYPGLLTLVLAFIALWKTFSSNRYTRYFLLSFIIAVLISLGKNTPLYGFLWKYLPGMNLFRFPQRFLAVATISLSLLGGIGIDHITGIASMQGRGRSNFAFIVALISLLVLVSDLLCFAHRQINTVERGTLLSGATLHEAIEGLEEKHSLGNYRIVSLGAEDTWEECYFESSGWLSDLSSFRKYWVLLPADYNILHNVENIEAQGNYGIERIKFLNDWTMKFTMIGEGRVRVPDSSVRIWAVENVGYLVSRYQIESPYLQGINIDQVNRTGKEEGDPFGELYIYRNTLRLPRVYMVSDYQVIRLEEEHIYDLFGKNFDPGKTVYLEEDPGMNYAPSSEDESPKTGESMNQIEIVDYSEERVEIRTESSRGGLLVLSDAYYPGWKAMVDGDEKPILRANIAFRAIALSPGRHHVIFTYTPPSFKIGAILASLGWLGCAIALLVLFFRQKR